MALVSVPYRGLILFNLLKTLGYKKTHDFPSPIGDLFYLINDKLIIANDADISVPYRGLILFNLSWLIVDHQRRYISVPYRGLILFNEMTNKKKVAIIAISVPYRGLILFN